MGKRKVIAHCAYLYPDLLAKAIQNLLENTQHEGTVVRWSAALALGEIAKLGSNHNKTLIPALEATCVAEEKNSIQKVYFAALKKVS